MSQRRSPLFTVLAIVNFVAALLFISCAACANISDAGGEWHANLNGVQFDSATLLAHLHRVRPC